MDSSRLLSTVMDGEEKPRNVGFPASVLVGAGDLLSLIV
jgi:hypothetical protein